MKDVLLAAVEALEECCARFPAFGEWRHSRIDAALSLLRAALEAREPVAMERLVNAYGNAERRHASAVYSNAPVENVAACQREVIAAYDALLAASPAAAPVEAREEQQPVAWALLKRAKDEPYFVIEEQWLSSSRGKLRAMLDGPASDAASAIFGPRLVPLVVGSASPAAATQGDAWQPIETAPKVKDAPLLLTNGESVSQGWWMDEPGYIRENRDLEGRYIDQDESDGFTGWMDCDGGMQPEPTHWMPMPPPPAAIGAESEQATEDGRHG